MDNEVRKKNHLCFIIDHAKSWWLKIKDTTYDGIVIYLYRPTDPSSLGIIRFLFGFLMLVDLPEERGGATIDVRWGDPKDCHFPLFPGMQIPSLACISLLYCLMWIGALGIMIGYKFNFSCLLFGIPYWYILLLDKSFWNNHSYLFGIVTILLMGSSANHFFSVDGYLDEAKRNKHVPYWNYFILKFQFFMLYFLAGLKKTDMEWLEGYSMTNLGEHWVFTPFRLVLSPDSIDYLIVHWFGFLLDLTIGFWMLIEFTRPVAMLFCAMFHLMNSRLFSIGMFPYVCLATMPLFCDESWPCKIISHLMPKVKLESPGPSSSCIYDSLETPAGIEADNKMKRKPAWKHRLVVALLLCHCGLQTFLPYSHAITKGFNNWTNGLYGYSWDMMVHSWDTIHVVVKVVDNNNGKEYFIDSDAWTLNDRWNKHADMCLQYAQCLKRNLIDESNKARGSKPLTTDEVVPQQYFTSENLSIYVDVWCSLNKRFQQRMFNPNYDLLNANWSPFENVEWLLPVLSEYNDFRHKMNDIAEEVYSWSNDSDVLFIADFPGLHLENFISSDMTNVTLTVLEGEVIYEIEDNDQSVGERIRRGESIPVEVETFHKIHTISSTPSCYMYTFVRGRSFENHDASEQKYVMYSPFPLIENTDERLKAFKKMWSNIANAILNKLLGMPYEVNKVKM